MRVLIDYRAALRQRSGVGEYTHELARALTKMRAGSPRTSLELTLFSSSWKDRLLPVPDLSEASIVDRKVPVSALNLLWHRLEWPAVEAMAGAPFDVVHSMHPLLMPSRRAAQIVSIHDLNFLQHPERTRAEIRRDYPALVRAHAHRADAVVVVSAFTATETERLLGIERDRIWICSPGAPPWTPRATTPARGYLLFFGTLEPRKNLGALLDAYERMLLHRTDVPELVLAGRATAESSVWLDRIARAPLAGHVRHIGYVADDARQALYEGACLLAQPSFEEGFGLTVLEAMTVGVPVVAADRGALPEVLGGAGVLVDTTDRDEFAAALLHVVDHAAEARRMSDAGIARAKAYSWDAAAQQTVKAYSAALARRGERRGAA